ncbi:bifunctional 2-polyprenyl-6-hydroxyphenol methylase/3-demethylubiquinol 3-O-methyltransferase UbiG [Rickettsiales endosymbiont of Stachyamoeba lipophora]|uniref:bifunctional 2-polyprenyl-6-hydroxyphenol methylase/3-demethylubiquinol 3-O-methyltransferase UbiG n=1 Tax=Rickettsiales endosymbiont of Stachyamoeba lipophora TaxID=2486578 RepID=UPI000F652E3C|nr:bifunctional 2-polyprenyl-6-hydroxyphenol methylase/3-demethylubiquinol 3-O-methyltransferase UbiG [Rickettsiales endosymbiont of Stachyamoeba lipophora]AZL15981.1 bifunctional 2-polyprenyl-6-hydroxyphenol methylase/3-demethylubiquinol 3-O-methyltransferase UbiG [Rickettsiales endosymbiont of Stachyamoeba lipophora]
MANKHNITSTEVEKFASLSDQWWDANGPFKPLHIINPTRISYLKEHICRHYTRDLTTNKPLNNLDIIDIGCGGGLVSEPLCRLGGNVTGVDASEKNIGTAKFHASQMGLNINYTNSPLAELITNNTQYDVVLALEVIEHVDNLEEFINDIYSLCKPQGLIILSTINRTIKSYLSAIIGAEYILRWLPIGTHSWDKFLKPSEIVNQFKSYNAQLLDISGLSFNPLNSGWKITNNFDINYFISIKKK